MVSNQLIRVHALPYVSYVVDDAGNGREFEADPHAIIRWAHESTEWKYSSVLVGWQCGFEPVFVAVHSYLDVEVSSEDAVEMARNYLEEIEWFRPKLAEPDFIIR
jgi:hypothetical protein